MIGSLSSGYKTNKVKATAQRAIPKKNQTISLIEKGRTEGHVYESLSNHDYDCYPLFYDQVTRY